MSLMWAADVDVGWTRGNPPTEQIISQFNENQIVGAEQISLSSNVLLAVSSLCLNVLLTKPTFYADVSSPEI